MKKRRTNKLLLSALFAIILLVVWGCVPSTDTSSVVKAPAFHLNTLDGTTAALEDYEGQVVFLNFWATWCPPCRLEMPYINELANSPVYEGKVAFVTINGGESIKVVSAFMDSQGYDFTVLLDTDSAMSYAYNVRSIPCTFVIDKHGIMKYKKIGAFISKDQISTILNQYID